MARTRAGQLRHRLRIERPQTDTSASGETIITGHECIGKPWCSIDPLRGQELLLARQTNAETTHQITMRHRCDIRTSDRLRKGDRVFEIESILNPGERNEWLEVMAVERSPER